MEVKIEMHKWYSNIHFGILVLPMLLLEKGQTYFTIQFGWLLWLAEITWRKGK